ncbi:hypothetical protein CRUP_028603, partial [Coryphaenoides rupestris]
MRGLSTWHKDAHRGKGFCVPSPWRWAAVPRSIPAIEVASTGNGGVVVVAVAGGAAAAVVVVVVAAAAAAAVAGWLVGWSVGETLKKKKKKKKKRKKKEEEEEDAEEEKKVEEEAEEEKKVEEEEAEEEKKVEEEEEEEEEAEEEKKVEEEEEEEEEEKKAEEEDEGGGEGAQGRGPGERGGDRKLQSRLNPSQKVDFVILLAILSGVSSHPRESRIHHKRAGKRPEMRGDGRFEVDRKSGQVRTTGLPLQRDREYLLTVVAADRLGSRSAPAGVSV